jgi:HEAT repeat protein
MNEVRRETLSQVELDAMREANAARERLAVSVPLFVVPSEEAGESSIERTELGDATLESLLADLAKREASASETNDTPLYLKFKAMVYLHPESSTNLGKILATADVKSATMRILTGALGAVGHAQAQAALVSVIQARREDWPALSLLIPALSESANPTQASEDLLRDLAFGSPNPDIASTAQLSLGSMARKLAHTDPGRAVKIVHLFVKAIESSPSADVTHQMLLALGNAGSTEAVPIISRFISDPSPTFRAAASAALRWVDSDQVDPILIRVLTSDRDATVRLEAARALGFRKMSAPTFQVQERAFLQEKDVNVRLSILSNLWNAHDEFPEVRRIVEQAAARDPSSEVRKAAGEIMKMYVGSPFRK